MTGLLEKHIAAITGAGSGIGRAIALGYAKAGAAVVALDANADTAHETASAIRREGGSAWSYQLDVRDGEACRHLAATVNASVGEVSVLVNNAGINRRHAFTAEPAAVVKDWQDVLAVNLNVCSM
jgi:3-oxoacyl-[acyl-carrier protein] reductase